MIKFEDVKAELAKMDTIRNRLENNEITFNTMTLDELTELDRIISRIVEYTHFTCSPYEIENDANVINLLAHCKYVAYFTNIHISMKD